MSVSLLLSTSSTLIDVSRQHLFANRYAICYGYQQLGSIIVHVIKLCVDVPRATLLNNIMHTVLDA